MKIRVVISAFILALAIPALAATASTSKSDQMKKPNAEKGQMHSKKGTSESMHHRNWHHHGKVYGKSKHHMGAHKVSKGHSMTKPASTSSKGHHKKG